MDRVPSFREGKEEEILDQLRVLLELLLEGGVKNIWVGLDHLLEVSVRDGNLTVGLWEVLDGLFDDIFVDEYIVDSVGHKSVDRVRGLVVSEYLEGVDDTLLDIDDSLSPLNGFVFGQVGESSSDFLVVLFSVFFLI